MPESSSLQNTHTRLPPVVLTDFTVQAPVPRLVLTDLEPALFPLDEDFVVHTRMAVLLKSSW